MSNFLLIFSMIYSLIPKCTTGLFKFFQGTHESAKVGRGIIYGILAVGTLGVSEVFTSPIEGSLGRGAEMQLRVEYDSDEKVDEVLILEDNRWVPVQEIKEARKAEKQ